jgi:hypothetical protein
MPAARAAAVIVQLDRILFARSTRPRGVRRALGWAIEGSFSTAASNTSSRRMGPQPVNNLIELQT